MNAPTKSARTAIALLVGVGSLLLAAGPVTAISHRGLDGTAVIHTSVHSKSPASVGSNVAGGRAIYR